MSALVTMVRVAVLAATVAMAASQGPLSMSCNVSGLAAGTTKTYYVRANSAVATGAASRSASATTWNVPGAPSAPSVAPTSPGSYDYQPIVEWSAPASDGGSRITSFMVYRDGVATSNSPVYVPWTFMRESWTGFVAGTRYNYSVSAVNSVGEGPRSPVTSHLYATIPGLPTSLRVSVVDPSSNLNYAFSWSPPSSDGGLSILGYIITYTNAAGATIEARTSELFWADPTGPQERATPSSVTYSHRAYNLLGGGTTWSSTLTYYAFPTAGPTITSAQCIKETTPTLAWRIVVVANCNNSCNSGLYGSYPAFIMETNSTGAAIGAGYYPFMAGTPTNFEGLGTITFKTGDLLAKSGATLYGKVYAKPIQLRHYAGVVGPASDMYTVSCPV